MQEQVTQQRLQARAVQTIYHHPIDGHAELSKKPELD
jgi:hypothetical protein